MKTFISRLNFTPNSHLIHVHFVELLQLSLQQILILKKKIIIKIKIKKQQQQQQQHHTHKWEEMGVDG